MFAVEHKSSIINRSNSGRNIKSWNCGFVTVNLTNGSENQKSEIHVHDNFVYILDEQNNLKNINLTIILHMF